MPIRHKTKKNTLRDEWESVVDEQNKTIWKSVETHECLGIMQALTFTIVNRKTLLTMLSLNLFNNYYSKYRVRKSRLQEKK